MKTKKTDLKTIIAIAAIAISSIAIILTIGTATIGNASAGSIDRNFRNIATEAQLFIAQTGNYDGICSKLKKFHTGLRQNSLQNIQCSDSTSGFILEAKQPPATYYCIDETLLTPHINTTSAINLNTTHC